MHDTEMITCPVCKMTSYHPVDVEMGWCSNCKDYTSSVSARLESHVTEIEFTNPPWQEGAFVLHPLLEDPGNAQLQRDIESTPNLSRASMENALLFGGPLLREVLQNCPLVGDRPHTIVDTKVTMLLPGFIPAIPGWHTDGVPRGAYKNPYDTGFPSMAAQLDHTERGLFPRFHTLIVGNPCLTEFVEVPVTLNLEHSEDPELYKEVSRQINQMKPPTISQPEHRWISWSWWNLHRAVPATTRGWRLQIRVAEMYHPPLETGFIRAQNQVYVSTEFGW